MKQFFLSVLGALVRIAGIEHLKAQVFRTLLSAMFGALATFCAMAAIICLVDSLWIFLIPLLGQAGAALAMGVLFLVLTIGLLFAAKYAWTDASPPKTVAPPAPAPLLLQSHLTAPGVQKLATTAISGFIVGIVGGGR
jgi:hypothetical protein